MTAVDLSPPRGRTAERDGGAANQLLHEVLAAHGGLERWRQVSALRAQIRSGGLALTLRGQGRAYRSYEALLSTREPWLSFSPFKGGRGHFRADRVWLDDRRGHAERVSPRAAFSGFRRRVYWDSLDVLYFGGYAIWNYLCTPFLLAHPQVQVRELAPWVENGEEWRRLEAIFPTTIPTHCQQQVFYVDGRGFIRRHDYVAEVIGGFARAAHYCDRHRAFGGLVFPTRRRVYPRLSSGKHLGRPTLIWIDVDDVQTLEDPPDAD